MRSNGASSVCFTRYVFTPRRAFISIRKGFYDPPQSHRLPAQVATASGLTVGSPRAGWRRHSIFGKRMGAGKHD
jgi:hypothetical protein